MKPNARQAAIDAIEAGLSVVPPEEDGSKKPLGKWSKYQTERASLETIDFWYGQDGTPRRSGCGIVCGAVSGNLECFEFDAGGRLYEHFKATARDMGHGDLIDRLEAGYLERSPSGGYHWLYRCSVISGNTKLAVAADGLSLIETRGEGGYIIVAPSNGKVHQTGGAYTLLAGGFSTIPVITPEERLTLWDLARMLGEFQEDRSSDPWIIKIDSIGNTAPWDDYNARTNWRDLLTEHGWTHCYTHDGTQYWRRPGKDHSHSATVNHGGTDRLKCFSSSAEFDTSGTYSRFGAYAVWEHGGDWKAAIKALKKETKEQKAKPKPPPPGTSLVVRLDQIEPKDVRWLWPGRIPKGFITIFYGTTGVGKSFVTLDIAARLTRGDAWPDSGGECCNSGNVLIISEDPFEYVLAPRLIELGAQMNRVFAMTWEAMQTWALNDVETLGRAFHQSGDPVLIVIDPPTNFLGDIDEHKNSEVRAALMMLVIWLDRQTIPVACILITHVNKSAGKGIEAIYRLLGSVAWGSTARIAHALTVDPDDKSRCLFVCSKSNIGEKPTALSFCLKRTDKLAKVEWLGEVDTTADEAMSGEKKKPRGVQAVEWVTEQFRKQREWTSEELKQNAKEAGLSKNALWSPEVAALPIQKQQHRTADGERFWSWVALPDWPKEKKVSGKMPGKVGKWESDTTNPLQDNTYLTFPNCSDGRESEEIGKVTNESHFPETSHFPDSGVTFPTAGKVTYPLPDNDLRCHFPTFPKFIDGEEKISAAVRFLLDSLFYGERSLAYLEEQSARVGIRDSDLRSAADRLGVERTIRDGGEYWFLQGRLNSR